MKPIIKTVKIPREHCPVCKQMLGANSSFWECKCGKWVAYKYPFTGEYKIIKLPTIKQNDK